MPCLSTSLLVWIFEVGAGEVFGKPGINFLKGFKGERLCEGQIILRNRQKEEKGGLKKRWARKDCSCSAELTSQENNTELAAVCEKGERKWITLFWELKRLFYSLKPILCNIMASEHVCSKWHSNLSSKKSSVIKHPSLLRGVACFLSFSVGGLGMISLTSNWFERCCLWSFACKGNEAELFSAPDNREKMRNTQVKDKKKVIIFAFRVSLEIWL